MSRLFKRVDALEGARTNDSFSHLSDDQLQAELVAVLRELQAVGALSSPLWQRRLDRGQLNSQAIAVAIAEMQRYLVTN